MTTAGCWAAFTAHHRGVSHRIFHRDPAEPLPGAHRAKRLGAPGRCPVFSRLVLGLVSRDLTNRRPGSGVCNIFGASHRKRSKHRGNSGLPGAPKLNGPLRPGYAPSWPPFCPALEALDICLIWGGRPEFEAPLHGISPALIRGFRKPTSTHFPSPAKQGIGGGQKYSATSPSMYLIQNLRFVWRTAVGISYF